CPGANQGGYQQPQQPNAYPPPTNTAGGYSASGLGSSSGGYAKRFKRQYGGGPPAVSPPAGYSSASQQGNQNQPVFGSPNLPGGVGGRCGPSGCFLSGGGGGKAVNPNQLKLIEKGCVRYRISQK
uniref:Distal-less n=1 Tax=Romanomermis culicivorax TaxID=13658 RepID=A0A915K0R7_ROMCU